MSSISDRSHAHQTRSYDRANSVVFLKTDGLFGGLSNMAGGYPLHVQGARILTSEALYQACRFPHLPEVQRLIIGQTSPMTAKMKSKPHRNSSRPDWNHVRVKVMRWCLRVKLAQNWAKFSDLLLRTGDRPIVEESRKDHFWGAKPVDEQTLVGMNVLGRLLMELREAVKSDGQDSFLRVDPPNIADFMLLGRTIGTIAEQGVTAVAPGGARAAVGTDAGSLVEQTSLFNQPEVREAPPPYFAPVQAEHRGFADLKPYTTMKDSGVLWLGEVPEHWSVLPNRALFTEVKERDHPNEEMLSVTITNGVIQQRTLLAGTSKKDSSNLDKAAYKLVRPGDIAYNKMRAWQGAIGASPHQGIVSPAYVVQRPRAGCDSRYFHYLLRTPAFAKEAERWSYGITSDMWSLRAEHFKMIYGCLPPSNEQAAIVSFLNYADRRIRRYIRAKQKLVKLLEEQKRGLIHRAVTRGLDPNVRFKPSGAEWLGDVPEHWSFVALKYLSKRVQNGATPPTSEPAFYENGTVPWYGPSSCGQVEQVSFPVRYLTEAAFNAGRGRLINGPALLVIVIGATAGRMALLSQNGATNQQITAYELRTEFLNPRFILHQLRGAERWLRSTASTATIPILDGGLVSRLPVAITSLAEQESILDHADAATSDLTRAIDQARREVELLREYRTRLLADVVTGKLYVCDAAVQLPETPKEQEPLDEVGILTDEDEETADDADAAHEEAEA